MYLALKNNKDTVRQVDANKAAFSEIIKYKTSSNTTSKKVNPRMKSFGRTYWEVLIGMTVAYFLIEIIVNILVFKQLSVKSDFLTIEGMEFWGKIITGVGAALALTKGFYALREFLKIGNSDYYFAGDSLKVIIPSLLICIPLSFILQNKLIDTLVENSTPEERNKAILITSTQATLKPHYNPHSYYGEPTGAIKFLLPIGGMKASFSDSYYYEQYALFNAAKNCISLGSKTLGVDSNIDKAFFSYNAFHSPLKEDLYKQLVTDYNSCLMDDESYQVMLIPKPQFDESKLEDFYREYRNKSRRILKPLAEINNTRSTGRWRENALKKYNEFFDREWSKGLRKQLGFASTMPAGLEYEEFVVHPDIQRYLREHAKADQQDYILYSDGFEDRLRKKGIESLKEMLPNTAIPTYVSEGDDKPLGMLIEYPKGYTGTKINLTDEQVEESGKRAYKAIVMPIVALGASLTFLILNLIIVTSQFIVFLIFRKDYNNKPPASAQLACSLILVSIVFSAPLLLGNDKVVETDNTVTNKLVNIIYHYEDILTSLTGNALNTVEKESYIKSEPSAFDPYLDSNSGSTGKDAEKKPDPRSKTNPFDRFLNPDSNGAVETVDIN